MAKGYWVVFADVSDPKGTRNISPRTERLSPNTVHVSLRAAGRPNRKRASRARAEPVPGGDD